MNKKVTEAYLNVIMSIASAEDKAKAFCQAYKGKDFLTDNQFECFWNEDGKEIYSSYLVDKYPETYLNPKGELKKTKSGIVLSTNLRRYKKNLKALMVKESKKTAIASETIAYIDKVYDTIAKQVDKKTISRKDIESLILSLNCLIKSM